MSRMYMVIFEPAETNWAAWVPDLPGFVTPGEFWTEGNGTLVKGSQGGLRRFAILASPSQD